MALPPGYLYGLETYNHPSDEPNSIGIKPGRCAGVNGNEIVVSTALVKKLNAPWAPGSLAGGLYDGVKDADEQYHLWLIFNSATGQTDALIETSAKLISPGPPAGFDDCRRIGSFMTDYDGNIRAFIQHGDYFQYRSPPLDVHLNGPGNAAVIRPLSIPTQLFLNVVMNVKLLTVGPDAVYISDPDVYDLAPAVITAPTLELSAAGRVACSHMCGTNEAGTIRVRMASGADNHWIYVLTRGWFDRRGRDGGF